MIIGTVTLITILLTGGSMSAFIFEDVEKQAKTIITEKDRQKEVMADLKDVKKTFKAFQKSRSAHLKDLRSVNLDRSAERSQFDQLKNTLYEERLELDRKLAQARTEVLVKITDEEWEQYMDYSVERAASRDVKEREAEEKGKQDTRLVEIQEAIVLSIEDQTKQADALQAYKDVKNSYMKMERDIVSRYPADNDVLKNKYASPDELVEIYTGIADLKSAAFWSITELHFVLVDLTDEKQYKKIMKKVNKLIE